MRDYFSLCLSPLPLGLQETLGNLSLFSHPSILAPFFMPTFHASSAFLYTPFLSILSVVSTPPAPPPKSESLEQLIFLNMHTVLNELHLQTFRRLDLRKKKYIYIYINIYVYRQIYENNSSTLWLCQQTPCQKVVSSLIGKRA